MRIAIVLILSVLLASCSLMIAPTPPRAFSLESALKLPFEDEVHPKKIDSFMGIDLEGMAVLHGRVVFYGFKFEKPSDARRAFKRIISRHILKIKLLDLPWFGSFELSSRGKKIEVWWSDVWLFAIEGDPKEVDSLYSKVKNAFSSFR